jgi:regulator of protease activity HflC (stomatin/prohibitin superfamily)
MEGVLSVLAVCFLVSSVSFCLSLQSRRSESLPQATVMLIERLGSFNRVASSGLNILVPFLDKPRGVYWTNTRRG